MSKFLHDSVAHHAVMDRGWELMWRDVSPSSASGGGRFFVSLSCAGVFGLFGDPFYTVYSCQPITLSRFHRTGCQFVFYAHLLQPQVCQTNGDSCRGIS